MHVENMSDVVLMTLRCWTCIPFYVHIIPLYNYSERHDPAVAM